MATHESHGRLLPKETVVSESLRARRTVRIYLPASYERSSRRRYPVLYLHDGQNVFTSAGPDAAFGWGGWDLDRIVDDLVGADRMREIIMVAVDNSRSRYLEYRGPAYQYGAAKQDGLNSPPQGGGDDRRYENYAQFLIRELKPQIDGEYRTLSGPSHTGVMGSSMGGICSLALAWQHPGVFGMAASLSGAFQVERMNFLKRVLQAYEGEPKPIRIYLDSGVVDDSGDDDGRANTEKVAAELRRIGWRSGTKFRYYLQKQVFREDELERFGLRRDKWEEAQTSQHNEFYWRLRAWRALVFLFPPLRARKAC